MPAASWLGGAGLLLLNGLYLARWLQFRRAWAALAPAQHGPTAAASAPESEQPQLPVAFGGVELQRATRQASASAAANLMQEPPANQFSVLVAARNEAKTLPQLLTDLSRQVPGTAPFEVLIVDDHSTDATAAVVAAAAATVPFPLRLLRLADLPGAPTGKKAAVQAAVQAARSPWVLLTDADCRVPTGWVQTYATLAAHDAQARFISGPVLLTGSGVLAALQGLELAGLVGVGAASIGLRQPTMCNGANLAYRRADFEAVNGYHGNEAVPSGDDEFLLHKLHAAFPGSIRFLRDQAAIVRTAAQPALRQLLRQRVRWASKWRHYQPAAPRRLAVLVLLANLTFPVGAGLWWLGLVSGPVLGASWALKLLADVALLRPVLRFLGRPRWLAWVPVLQLTYGPYALATGLLGLRGGYEWKGRQLRSR